MCQAKYYMYAKSDLFIPVFLPETNLSFWDCDLKKFKIDTVMVENMNARNLDI